VDRCVNWLWDIGVAGSEIGAGGASRTVRVELRVHHREGHLLVPKSGFAVLKVH